MICGLHLFFPSIDARKAAEALLMLQILCRFAGRGSKLENFGARYTLFRAPSLFVLNKQAVSPHDVFCLAHPTGADPQLKHPAKLD